MKTIPFTCPHCGTYTEVAEEYAGQTGPCAACRKPVTVPAVPQMKDIKPTRLRKLTHVMLYSLGGLVIAAIGVAIFGLVFVAAFQPSSIPFLGRVTPPPPICKSNLEQIGVAIQTYVKEKGHYPPAFTTDENGKPLHSWRVLILPYLGEQRLYSQLNLNEPWDSSANKAVVGRRMPDVYSCPTQSFSADETSYMVISGPTLIFDGNKERAPEEITDNLGDTIVVIEVNSTGIHWMEPVDLSVATMSWGINSDDGIGSRHGTPGIHALMADGQVKHIDAFSAPEELQAMATRSGGEFVDPAQWDNGSK